MPVLLDPDKVWELLAERIDQLTAAWESGPHPPALAPFAPTQPAAVRRLAIVELAKVDMEHRRRRGLDGWRVEDYLLAFAELNHGGIPCDLIYEEYHLRRQGGEKPDVADYAARFPQQADELRRLLGIEDTQRTTSLFPPIVSAPLTVGETVDDFDLLTELGSGAFATVFLARQRSLQRLVALKTSANAGTEPQTLAQLEHPHIVRVYDQRIDEARDLRLLYMQYVAGGTLQDVVKLARNVQPAQRSGRTLLAAVDAALDRAGQSTPEGSSGRQTMASSTWTETVCRVGMQLASALDYAHRRGVLHRDLKPANVLMSADGAPRLADFNISFCSKLDGATPAAYFGGSLAYMSPEQLEACSPRHDRQPDELDGRSDIYSLGVVLWELLCGQRPFVDEQLQTGWNDTVEAMLNRRRRGVGAAERAMLGQLPPGVLDVLLACLHPDRQQRPSAAAEVEARLRLCLRPEALRLLAPANAGIRKVIQSWPALSVVAVALATNGAAAGFNLAYNYFVLVPAEDRAVFWKVQGIINSTAFPLGIAILVWLCRPVRRALHADSTDSLAGRFRSLSLGHWTAVLGIIEWCVAGFLYAVLMNMLAQKEMDAWYSVRFIASLALCGMMAATYPFFGVTFLSIRAFYPRLLPGTPPGGVDTLTLAKLSRRTWAYLILAASLPVLAVVVLVLLPGELSRIVLGILSIGSLFGFGLIFYLARAIQTDLATLQWIVQPRSDAEGADTGSFLTSSHHSKSAATP